MKKFILIIIFGIIPFFAFSNNEQPKDEEVTASVIYKDVKSVISDLADAMKVGGEYVFEKLVKQQ